MKARMSTATVILIAVLFAAVPFAGAAQNGVYKGKTASQYKVKVKVKKNRITLFDTDVYATCYGGSFGISFVFPPAGRKGATGKIKGNGSFKIVFKGDPGVSFKDDKRTVKGKFTGGRVSGSVKVEGLCSGSSTYTARK